MGEMMELAWIDFYSPRSRSVSSVVIPTSRNVRPPSALGLTRMLPGSGVGGILGAVFIS